MNDLIIHDRITATLHGWAGLPYLLAAMQDFPAVEVYLGGGAVRRVLLEENRAVKDFDFFLDGPNVDEFRSRLAANGVVDRTAYGSPRWFPGPDGSPSADLMHVKQFCNGLPNCRNVSEAMTQCDCTVNAVAVNLRTGTVIDPTGGRRDAERRVMRAVHFNCLTRPIRPDTQVTHLDILWLRIAYYARLLELKIESCTTRWLRIYCPSRTKMDYFVDLAISHGMRFGVDRFCEFRMRNEQEAVRIRSTLRTSVMGRQGPGTRVHGEPGR
jgi:hypothetical protein